MEHGSSERVARYWNVKDYSFGYFVFVDKIVATDWECGMGMTMDVGERVRERGGDILTLHALHCGPVSEMKC